MSKKTMYMVEFLIFYWGEGFERSSVMGFDFRVVQTSGVAHLGTYNNFHCLYNC